MRVLALPGLHEVTQFTIVPVVLGNLHVHNPDEATDILLQVFCLYENPDSLSYLVCHVLGPDVWHRLLHHAVQLLRNGTDNHIPMDVIFVWVREWIQCHLVAEKPQDGHGFTIPISLEFLLLFGMANTQSAAISVDILLVWQIVTGCVEKQFINPFRSDLDLYCFTLLAAEMQDADGDNSSTIVLLVGELVVLLHNIGVFSMQQTPKRNELGAALPGKILRVLADLDL
jgi:hypothetical protein